jgi:hypothetical protein
LIVPEPATAAPPADVSIESEGTPWERRAELGFVRAWMQTLQQALLEPGKLFAAARLDRGFAQLGFAVLTTTVFWGAGQVLERALLGSQRDQMRRMIEAMSRQREIPPMLRRMIDVQGQASSPGWFAALLVLTPLVTVILLYLNAAITHAFALLLGQAKRGFAATFAACAYACAPLVLFAVPACGSIVGILWLIVLTAVGMKVTHRISSGAAAATALAPYLVLCCASFVAFSAMALAFRSALGQP